MKNSFLTMSLLIAITVGFLSWQMIKLSEPDWLLVETQTTAVKGASFIVRITLYEQELGMHLGVDLHRMDSGKVNAGYLSRTSPVDVLAGRLTYEFLLPVPAENNTAFIFPVIVLSKFGTWDSRIKAAYTDLIPVKTYNGLTGNNSLTKRRIRNILMRESSPDPESVHLGIIISCLWIGVSIVSFTIRKNLQTGLITIIALFSSLIELLYTFLTKENPFRHLLQDAGLYEYRHTPQQIFTVVLIVISTIIFIYMISNISKSSKNILSVFIYFYWVVCILQILSLHEIDTILSVKIAGIHSGQMLRLLTSILCFFSALLILKKIKRGAPSGNFI